MLRKADLTLNNTIQSQKLSHIHMENNNVTTPDGGSSHGDYQTINGFLEKTNTALTNARLPEVAVLLAARGYSDNDISVGMGAADALRRLNELQQAEYGDQYEATKRYNDARSLVHENYMDHLELARLVFRKDPDAKAALGLRGTRAKSQSGYAGQGFLFYDNALNNVAFLTALGKKGITLEELSLGQAAFRNLQTLTAAQQKETGEAQAATRRRDAAYDDLSEWMSEFYSTAKIALRKNPQMMEKLGIKEV